MVYKKYIKKNGKLYGPYIYHSHRVNGKVVSEYHGAKKTNYKIFVFIALGVLSLALLISFFYNFNTNITGGVVQNSINQTGNKTEIIYPKVYFTLISKQMPIMNTEDKNAEEQTQTVSGITDNNVTGAEQSSESQISENQSDTGNSKITDENVTEGPQQNETETATVQSGIIEEENETETDTSEQQTEQSTQEPTSSTSDNADEQTGSETETSQPEQTEKTGATTSDTDSEQATNSETKNEQNSSSITGNVISQIFKTISDFFLSLKLTGKATSEPTIKEISGEVSAYEPFSYNLNEGENIELLSGSVNTDSGDLPDDVIQINYKNGQILVSTNYSEIVFNTTVSQNKTVLLNKSIAEEFNIEPLTNAEKEFLNEKLGNISVEVIKSELFNGRYIIKYKFGDYGIEYSYDSTISEDALKSQMETDKVKWLRDIINELSKKESIREEVDLS